MFYKSIANDFFIYSNTAGFSKYRLTFQPVSHCKQVVQKKTKRLLHSQSVHFAIAYVINSYNMPLLPSSFID